MIATSQAEAATGGGQGDGAGCREIFDPMTGELAPTDDVDGLIDLYERLRAFEQEMRAAITQVQRSLAAKTAGETRTRRLQGRRRRVRIAMPGPGWEQARLRDAWRRFPRYRDPYLRVDALAVNLREFKKLVHTAGPDELESFKAALAAARKPPTGNPRVWIEV